MLIVDTGPFVAAADRADPDHRTCLALLEAHPGPLVTTSIVVTEVGWLIRRELDASAEATLDHRDFRVVRPAHCDAFELIPEPAA